MGQLNPRPPITLTATEWASVQPDGTLWLAWAGVCSLCIEGGNDHESFTGAGTCVPNLPPLEFALACAPCDHHQHDDDRAYCPACGPGGCPDCRIELELTDGFAFPVVVGHAYAIGQPLPIRWYEVGGDPSMDDAVLVGMLNGKMEADAWTDQFHHESLTAALAHYGPPETLVGRWAIQLAVCP